jgi:hypothetical protein
MSAFNAACMLLFPSIGFVALAIGLLARRYSLAALVIGLIGLSSLAAAAAFITTSGRPQSQQVEKVPGTEPVPGNVVLEKGDGQHDAVSSTADAATAAEIQRLDSILQTERDQHSAADRKAAELEQDLRGARQGRSTAEAKVAVLETKLALQQSPPAKASPPDIPSIRARFEAGEQPHYSTRPAEPLIPGQKGEWYVIRLLDNGQPLAFSDRQFILPDAAKIKASIGHLRACFPSPRPDADGGCLRVARQINDRLQAPSAVSSPICRDSPTAPIHPRPSASESSSQSRTKTFQLSGPIGSAGSFVPFSVRRYPTTSIYSKIRHNRVTSARLSSCYLSTGESARNVLSQSRNWLRYSLSRARDFSLLPLSTTTYLRYSIDIS